MALCLPSAAASAELGKQRYPAVYEEGRIHCLVLFLASLKKPLLPDGGVEVDRFSYLKHPEWTVSYPCCSTWVNPVCAFEKPFTETSLTCRSDLGQQGLTTGFPPMLMPLCFAGFGHCFCLPALHRSPQHIVPSGDFHRCVGCHAVVFSSCFNFFTNMLVLARCKRTVTVVSQDQTAWDSWLLVPSLPWSKGPSTVGVWRRPVADVLKCLLHTTCCRINTGFCWCEAVMCFLVWLVGFSLVRGGSADHPCWGSAGKWAAGGVSLPDENVSCVSYTLSAGGAYTMSNFTWGVGGQLGEGW